MSEQTISLRSKILLFRGVVVLGIGAACLGVIYLGSAATPAKLATVAGDSCMRDTLAHVPRNQFISNYDILNAQLECAESHREEAKIKEASAQRRFLEVKPD